MRKGIFEAALLLVGVLIGILTNQYLSATSTKTVDVSDNVPFSAASWMCWVETGNGANTYYYRSLQSGTKYNGTIGDCIRVASDGQTILVKTGTYPPFVLCKNCSIIGESAIAYPEPAPYDPDDMPIDVDGTVIQVTGADNGITLEGCLSGIEIENIAIRFSSTGSGHGVYSAPGKDNVGLLYSTLNNIIVFGHDADHYAFYLENFMHVIGNMLLSFGGPAFHFGCNSTNIKYGNSHFTEPYARVNRSIYITKNIVEFIGTPEETWVNLMICNRLQITDWTTTNSHWDLFINKAQWITLNQLDLETSTGHNLIGIDSSRYVNILPHLVYAGTISFSNTVRCGFSGNGYIDHSDYSMMTTGTADYVDNIEVVGSGLYSGFAKP